MWNQKEYLAVLVVDEMGKHISGGGMDWKVDE